MSDNSKAGPSGAPTPAASPASSQQGAVTNTNTNTNQSTAALIQQLVQRWGLVATLANPLAGIALSAAGGAAGSAAQGSEAGSSGTDGDGQVSANAMASALASGSPFGVLQSVLSSIIGGRGSSSSMRLLILGLLIAYARSLYDNAASIFQKFFVTTVELTRNTHAPSLPWIEVVLENSDIMKKLSVVTIDNHNREEDEAIARGQDVPLTLGLPDQCEISFFLNARTGRVYPSFFDALRLRNRTGGKAGRAWRRLRLALMRVLPGSPHAIHYAWFSCFRDPNQGLYGNDRMLAQLSTVTRSRQPLEQFLKHARFVHARNRTLRTLVYVSDPINRQWDLVTQRPKRLFSTVLLEGRTQQALLGDIREFLSDRMRTFYAQRGVPHRRGYLLWGPPGSGKTSSIVAIAGELNLNVYALSLAQRGLDERLLLELANDCQTPSILLLEDIDAAFTGRTKMFGQGADGDKAAGSAGAGEDDDADAAADAEGAQGSSNGGGGPTVGAENRVTFSALLQLLDGAASSENRIVFCTTNHLDRLDPALIRPGRIDVRVAYHNASRRQAKGLFCRIFTTLSAKELDGRLIEARRAWQEASAHRADELGSGVGENGSAAASIGGGGGEGEGEGAGTASARRLLRRLRAPTDADFEDDIFHPELVRLATEFAAQVPERVLSMAQLQGFLIKRAMWAQQEARVQGVAAERAAAAAAGPAAGEKVKTKEKHHGNGSARDSHKDDDDDDDRHVLGIEKEEDSAELRDMLAAARRAVREIAAFVENGADDADVGVSL